MKAQQSNAYFGFEWLHSLHSRKPIMALVGTWSLISEQYGYKYYRNN